MNHLSPNLQRHRRTVTRFCDEVNLGESDQLDLAEFILAAQYLGADATDEQLTEVFMEMEKTPHEDVAVAPKEQIKNLLQKVQERYGASIPQANDEKEQQNHEIVALPKFAGSIQEDAEWQELQLQDFLTEAAKDSKIKIAKHLLLKTAFTKEQIAEITGIQPNVLDEYDSDSGDDGDNDDIDDNDEETSVTQSHAVSDTAIHVPTGSGQGNLGVNLQPDNLSKALAITPEEISKLEEIIQGNKPKLIEKADDALILLKKLQSVIKLSSTSNTKKKKNKSKLTLDISNSFVNNKVNDDGKEKDDEKLPKKYRVVISPGALIKTKEQLDSEEVAKLPIGTVVVVDEIVGRRARITKPVSGWCSIESTDNRIILMKESTKSPEMERAIHAHRARQTKILILKSITTLNDTTVQRILEKSDWNLRRAIEAFYIAKYKTQEYLKSKENENNDKSPQPGGKRKGWWKSWKTFIKQNNQG